MLTSQQQTILDHVISTPGLTMVDAKAGAGKTTLLVEISKALQPTSALYLAYNKSVAVEASHKFPKSVHCCTTHSLAFKPTVTQHKLKLGIFNYKSISEPLNYEHKEEFLEYFRQFCLSSHTSFQSFATDFDVPHTYIPLANKYLSLMQAGSIECTHDFYLKYFHMLLADSHLTYPTFDLVMLDEAGDLNEVTLEIFKLLPATRKVMVGDPYQNIYTFNHTINCFEAMDGQGTLLPMTHSFRVADFLAERISRFGSLYLDPSFEFEGIPLTDTSIHSTAFISRTNAALIDKMFQLNATSTPYGLARSAKQIFQLPLAFCAFKYQGFISVPEYKHLQPDIDDYFEDAHIRADHKSLYAYLKYLYPKDNTLIQTINLIIRYGKPQIIACYEEARKHEKSNQTLTLGTGHSLKGSEFDHVILAEDVNEAIAELIAIKSINPSHTFTKAEFAELYLFYVAATRARKQLTNARYL